MQYGLSHVREATKVSYFQRPSSSGTSVTLPLVVGEGGTGAVNKGSAVTNLTSAAFSTSSQNVNWGSTAVDSPILPADLDNVADVLDQLILALNALGVLG